MPDCDGTSGYGCSTVVRCSQALVSLSPPYECRRPAGRLYVEVPPSPVQPTITSQMSKFQINYTEQLFQKASTTDLRGYSLKLYKKSSRLDIRDHFFSAKELLITGTSYRTT